MSHLELGTLFDYWTAELPADEEQALEEHVFACDACARRLETTGALVRAIPQGIGRRGGLKLCVTRGLLEQLAGGGLVLRHYRVRLGDAVQCSVGAEDDMLVTWIAGDFGGVERVTVRFFVDGAPVLAFEDAPIDREANEIIYALGGDMARSLPTNRMITRVYALEGENERLLGEATFEHTAFSA